jgi:FkbM family methyltransferase
MSIALPDTEEAPFGTFAPDGVAHFVLGKRDFNRPRRAWPLWRKLGKSWLHKSQRVFDLTYRGFRLRLHPATNAGDEGIVLNGIHGEEDEFQRVEARVAEFENFIDIGANIGLYSLLAARNLPEGRPIVAFEPDAGTVRRLRINLALNGVTRVDVVEAAVSPARGEMSVFQAAHSIGLTSAYQRYESWTEQKVPTLPLAEALAERGIARIGMLKIDIEGFEDQALLPYLDVMPPESWPRYILIEVCHNRNWKRDAVAELRSKGYRDVFRNTRNIHFERDGGPA